MMHLYILKQSDLSLGDRLQDEIKKKKKPSLCCKSRVLVQRTIADHGNNPINKRREEGDSCGRDG